MSANQKAANTGKRQAKKPKNNKKTKKSSQSTRFKPGPSKAPKANRVRLLNKYAKERAFFERVVINQLLLEKDYLYPRVDGQMTCSKLLPWTIKLPLVNIDETGATSFKVRPDPDRLIEFISPPTGGNSPKDASESITVNTSMANPSLFYFDHDLTMTSGSATAEHAGAQIANLDPGVYYSENDKAFKSGTKMYKTGPFVAGLPWNVAFKNNSSKEITVVAVATLILSNPDGGFIAGVEAGCTMIVSAGQLSNQGLAPWGAFAFASEAADVVGFTLSFRSELTGASSGDSTISNHGNQYSLIWPLDPLNKPVFGSAYTWIAQSLWDIKGAPSTSLKAEWDSANVVSVTGCDMNLANFSANLNLNGSVFGAIIKDASSEDPPGNPNVLHKFIDDLNADAYRMKKPMKANDGTHSVLPLSEHDCAFLPTNFFRRLDRQSESVNYRPYFVVAAICDAPITPGTKPTFEVSGTIHLEWRTNSLLMTPRKPPTNLAFFNQVRHQLMLDEEYGTLWTHNPDHFSKFKSFAKKIVGSDLFKTVLRDAAEVGIETLATMLI